MSVAPFPSLRPGARLAVIAPSGPFDRQAFERGATRLSERFELSYGEGLFAQEDFLAGDDKRRAEELLGALRDEAIDGIVAARGGYGATRLLARIPLELVAAANKPLIGFSDITALHALWARAGVPSLHATMVASFAQLSAAAEARWYGALEGEELKPCVGLTSLGTDTTVEGPLHGGNLAVLTALLATPYMPPLRGAVLFLEEVGEAAYRVDRMLTQLEQAGVFDQLAGIVLGAFSEGREAELLPQVFARCLPVGRLPVVTGVKSGHIEDPWPLRFGVSVRLDGRGSLIL